MLYRACLVLAVLATCPAFAQTTVTVWAWGEWQERTVSEQYLMITPSASPTPILEAAGFPGFEHVWDTTDCQYLYGIFERPYAPGAPLPYSTVEVIETLGAGDGSGYFWSPVLLGPAPEAAITLAPLVGLRFEDGVSEAQGRAIIAQGQLGAVVWYDPSTNVSLVVSTTASGLELNERVNALVDHPSVASVTPHWLYLNGPGACPSGGGGEGSPWPPSGGVGPVAIPTLSEWMLGVFVLLIAGAAMLRLPGEPR